MRIGTGMRVTDTHVVAEKSGVLRQTGKGQLWIEGRQKRYFPAEGDAVVGLVTERKGDEVRVDISAPFPARLSLLTFEGAHKRNLPKIDVGNLVFARVTAADKDLDPELSCVDAQGRASGFGKLEGGLPLTITNSYARNLLRPSPPHPVLQALASTMQYEVVVGINGRIWVNAGDARTIIRVVNVLRKGEYVDELSAEQYVRDTLQQLEASMAPPK